MITNRQIKELQPGTEYWVKHEYGKAVVYERVERGEHPKFTFAELCRIDNTLRTIEEME